jgi:SAM-dependent methyltransferase
MEAWPVTEYGDAWADRYDETFAWLADTDATVAAIAARARGGPVLELGTGTGRLAIPLACAGIETHGIEISRRMVGRMLQKPGAEQVKLHVADFSRFDFAERFKVIFSSANTLSELPDQERQLACLQSAARHLDVDGALMIELVVPDPRLFDDRSLRVTQRTDDSVTTVGTLHDRVTQRIVRQYVTFGSDGVRLGCVRDRYVWPSELDLMARLAGLRLEARWADWSEHPFTAASRDHVSVYAKDG